MKTSPSISRVLLYVKDMPKVANFYVEHFGFSLRMLEDSIELSSSCGGCALLIHKASKGHRVGQSSIKLIFDVDDVEAFKTASAKRGLVFGKTHKGPNYEFSNARDPAKNPIQISNRALQE